MATRYTKAERLPPKAEILRIVREMTTVLSSNPKTEAFFVSFAEQVAGSTRSGSALHILWDTSFFTKRRELPPPDAAAIARSFDDVVRAIAPTIAADAIRARNRALEHLKEARR